MTGLYDYEVGRFVAGQGYPFYALIQAALRQADSENYAALSHAFPEEARELEQRYHAPSGRLPTDPARPSTP